jgi:hypothetical protein
MGLGPGQLGGFYGAGQPAKSTLPVFGRSDRLEVIGIKAGPVSAKVVQFVAVRDGTAPPLVRYAVSAMAPTTKEDSGIPTWAEPLRVDPAVGVGVDGATAH